MTDDLKWCGRGGCPMWVSTRAWLESSVPGKRETRTMDHRRNPPVAGDYPVYSLSDVWELLESSELVPMPVTGREYRLLYRDSDVIGDLPNHPRLKRLGFDLSDSDHEGWSLLQDPCVWVGELAVIAARVGEFGLLSYEDAKQAQALFREAWPGIASFTVWALDEILDDVGAPVAEPLYGRSCQQWRTVSGAEGEGK